MISKISSPPMSSFKSLWNLLVMNNLISGNINCVTEETIFNSEKMKSHTQINNDTNSFLLIILLSWKELSLKWN